MYSNTSYLPAKSLEKYIDRYYLFEKEDNDFFHLPKILPGTGLELVFHLETALSVNNIVLPQAHTICPREGFSFDKTDKVSFLSVRFKSGRFRHFTKWSFLDLNDQFVSVDKLWGKAGSNLVAELKNIKSIEAKISCIDAFLLKMFDENYNPGDEKWNPIIDELYYQFNDINLANLSSKLQLSMRQFQRNFKSQFGITPKRFQQLARMQSIVKKGLLNNDKNYLDTIYDSGYFDQSHFIKEFKAMVKRKPLEYFNEQNFTTNFYHKSVNANSNTKSKQPQL
ncbi:AraC family transcriptional regulator [uncultured Tenacibaculum sp.]|uniref:helix-turn-helix domain-containing protein n=1 Tax=uncultured Tenacibaculum sp. TaxID=174713 RepID=UPI00260EECE1|nr:AraC family transcriptional regulator [uncultured Tenacibaculum sp.]